jgi:predicted nucleotidyltransferase
MNNQPTPDNDVNTIISLLLANSLKILNRNFLAMYLHGSLAVGDFHLDNSDIDFMIVINEQLSDETIQELHIMHSNLLTQISGWGKRLEGSFVWKELLKASAPPIVPRPYINGESFFTVPYGYEWVLEKYVLREKSIVVTGPPPEILIAPISFQEINEALKKLLRQDWKPLLLNSSRLNEEGYREYTVLTMSRCLFTFSQNKIVSKKAAAEWVRNRFPEWTGLINSALSGFDYRNIIDFEMIKKFIRFTIEFIK